MRNKQLDMRPTDQYELLLIRIGHHLWRSKKRKEWPEHVVSSALEAVWEAKEAYRVPLRDKWLESMRNRISRLEAHRGNQV